MCGFILYEGVLAITALFIVPNLMFHRKVPKVKRNAIGLKPFS
jgi:hypothetical protein